MIDNSLNSSSSKTTTSMKIACAQCELTFGFYSVGTSEGGGGYLGFIYLLQRVLLHKSRDIDEHENIHKRLPSQFQALQAQ